MQTLKSKLGWVLIFVAIFAVLDFDLNNAYANDKYPQLYGGQVCLNMSLIAELVLLDRELGKAH